MSQHNILRFPCHNRCDILSLEEVSSVSVHGQRSYIQHHGLPPQHQRRFRTCGEVESGEQEDVDCVANYIQVLYIKYQVDNESRVRMRYLGVLVSQFARFVDGRNIYCCP